MRIYLVSKEQNLFLDNISYAIILTNADGNYIYNCGGGGFGNNCIFGI